MPDAMVWGSSGLFLIKWRTAGMQAPSLPTLASALRTQRRTFSSMVGRNAVAVTEFTTPISWLGCTLTPRR